jgi:glutamate-1-semialdehyde 2,1-aminomutase
VADCDGSKSWFERAVNVVPGGVSSPVRAFHAVGGDPVFMERGEGAHLYDVDGNRYSDLCSSWGPLILGHCHPDVVAAVNDAVSHGMSFGTATPTEVELAEMMIDKVKPLETVRFVSSGTEAVMSAVRVARGYTGRDKIIKFDGCYHGHADHLLVKAGSGMATFGTPSSSGVPDDFAKHTLVAELDDEETVQKYFDKCGVDIAAVLIEPIPANSGLLIQRPEFLRFLRAITSKYESLLIFDEVISGFRVGWGGAAEMYEIEPDLMTFGKVIGGGIPVGAFGGKREIMDVLAPNGPVYQAGTLSANPVAMTAGLATLRAIESEDAFVKLEELGSAFESRLNEELAGLPVNVVRIGSTVWLALQQEAPTRASHIEKAGIEKYNSAHRAILDAGVYLPPSGYEVMFVSMAHTEGLLNEAASVIGAGLKM